MRRIGDLFGTQEMRSLAVGGIAGFGVLLALSAIGSAQPPTQTQQASPTPYQFEVASIRPSRSDEVGGNMTMLGRDSDRFNASSVELIKLIRAAYGIPLGAADSRISGGPDWLKSEKYDVDAVIDVSVVAQLRTLSQSQRTLAQQEMLQALLAERCGLVVHRETRNLPIYTLVIAKDGPKIQEANPAETTSMGFGAHGDTHSLTGHARSTANLAQALSVVLGCPVLDKTGLAEKYDFKLEWTAQDGGSQSLPMSAKPDWSASPADSSAPSIFEALQEQLGLKLVSGKGPVEILVIDRVERPSAN